MLVRSSCHALISLLVRSTDLSSLHTGQDGVAPSPNPFSDYTQAEGLDGSADTLLPLDEGMKTALFVKVGLASLLAVMLLGMVHRRTTTLAGFATLPGHKADPIIVAAAHATLAPLPGID